MADTRTEDEILASYYINGIIKPFVFWSSTQKHFFPVLSADTASTFGYFRLAAASMKDLMHMALRDEKVRTVCAENSLFEFLLTIERKGISDQIAEFIDSPVEKATTLQIADAVEQAIKTMVTGVPQILVDEAKVISGGSSRKCLRQHLLDAIYDAREGGFLRGEDKTGVVTWIHDDETAQAAIGSTIEFDAGQQYSVAANALRIVGDLTIPESWVRSRSTLPGASPVQSQLNIAVSNFRAGVATLDVNLFARAGLLAQADKALARFTRDLVALPVGGGGGGLPTFTLPGGKKINIVPGKPAPWYKNSRLIAAGALGLMIGGGYALRSKR